MQNEAYDRRRMTRRDDYPTSNAAADSVSRRKPTIRAQVIAFFQPKVHGATDSELKSFYWDAPESSYRKRRTELAQENILIAHGDTRENVNGESELVWRHRDQCFAPPPIKPRASKPPTKYQLLVEERDRLRARVAELEAKLGGQQADLFS